MYWCVRMSQPAFRPSRFQWYFYEVMLFGFNIFWKSKSDSIIRASLLKKVIQADKLGCINKNYPLHFDHCYSCELCMYIKKPVHAEKFILLEPAGSEHCKCRILPANLFRNRSSLTQTDLVKHTQFIE
jgi:hypothetical protein